MTNLFNYNETKNFFAFDYESNDENFCFQYENRICVLLYKAVHEKENINFKILNKILKFFTSALTKMVNTDVELSNINVDTMIFSLWDLHVNDPKDKNLYELTYDVLSLDTTYVTNMRNLIIRSMLNIKKYLASKNRKNNKFVNLEELTNMLENEASSDDVNIANIVRTSIEAVYPNHSKLLNHIQPSDSVLTDIQYGYMPAYNLDDDDWSMIENHDFLSWMGFNLNPDHDVIVCDDGKIFIISDYNEDLRGGIYSYAAWVRENHEWKFQPIEFWH